MGAALTLMLLLGTGGCQALAAAAYVSGIGSTRKVDAQFRIPEGPVVILIDDFLDVVQPPLAKEVLHDSLIDQLREHEAVALPITTRDELARLRRFDPDFDKKTIREVGRAAGAETMIWIKPTVYEVFDNLELAHSDGRFAVVVKVFDVTTEDVQYLRLWPQSRDGHQVTVTMNVHDIRASKSKAEIHRTIGVSMAEEIALLFYAHTVDR
jgi:hypothetical protein